MVAPSVMFQASHRRPGTGESFAEKTAYETRLSVLTGSEIKTGHLDALSRL
jgi:hypothetical protein